MPEVFAEIAALAQRLGVRSIKDLPGCWEHDVDGHWWIAVNGHRIPMKCSRGPEVHPFTVYVEWKGWPAGIITPDGGTLAAGDAANEDALIAALKAAGR